MNAYQDFLPNSASLNSLDYRCRQERFRIMAFLHEYRRSDFSLYRANPTNLSPLSRESDLICAAPTFGWRSCQMVCNSGRRWPRASFGSEQPCCIFGQSTFARLPSCISSKRWSLLSQTFSSRSANSPDSWSVSGSWGTSWWNLHRPWRPKPTRVILFQLQVAQNTSNLPSSASEAQTRPYHYPKCSPPTHHFPVYCLRLKTHCSHCGTCWRFAFAPLTFSAPGSVPAYSASLHGTAANRQTHPPAPWSTSHNVASSWASPGEDWFWSTCGSPLIPTILHQI